MIRQPGAPWELRGAYDSKIDVVDLGAAVRFHEGEGVANGLEWREEYDRELVILTHVKR
jgi:hypothetical protein